MAITGEELSFIINHVVLPPRLPQEEDPNLEYSENALLQLVHEQIILFVQQSSSHNADLWRPVLRMFASWRNCLSSNGTINTTAIQNALYGLQQGDAMAFYLRAQNSGVIIQQVSEALTRFSSFEAFPTNEQVMEPKGRLVRRFPGRCVEIETIKLHGSDLPNHIARSLYQLNNEPIKECMATTDKAKSTTQEVRETASPCFVTDFLFSVLAALGKSVATKPLYKNTRDDVLWDDCLKPWRRSPFWLVIRVALQTALAQAFPNTSKLQYKNFMLYMLSRIATVAKEHVSPPETCYFICAKLARRAHKLGVETMEFVIKSASAAVNGNRISLESSWDIVREFDKATISIFSRRATSEDVSQSLSHSKDHLRKAMIRDKGVSDPIPFKPQHTPRIQYDQNDLPPRIDKNAEDGLLKLTDVEDWVRLYLQAWVGGTPVNDSTCSSLATLIDSYIDLGCDTYRANSREMSLMLLTVVDLWVALDKMCVRLYPLLSQFSPEVPLTLLEPLLLPKLGQMQRLRAIEVYLRQRHSVPTSTTPSIFGDPRSMSFATRYYDSSPKLQALRANIEKEAQMRRNQKEAEWSQKDGEYRQLMREVANLSCTYLTDEDDLPVHASTCQRCRLVFRANGITIHLDEWPLPVDGTDLKTVIFELDCPKGFAVWRDSTYRILQKLAREFSINRSEKPIHHLLLEYNALTKYGINKDQNLTLGSSTKAYLKSHYKANNWPIQLESVCVNNALRYQMWDASSTAWVVESISDPSVELMCSTQLPKGPYLDLQYAVNSYLHPPNRVIAEQGKCSKELSLQEFLAFGTLRASGDRITWYNILRELGSANLSFNTEAVCTLFLQAAWQAGPSTSSSERRVIHAAFEGVNFCDRLLDVLETFLGAIEANWKEQYSMSMVVKIALRTLSLAPERSTEDRALLMLQKTRRITLQWCKDLAARLQDITEDITIEKTRRLLIKAASTCLATYDVDVGHVSAVLRGKEDLVTLVRSLVFIFDNTCSGVKTVTGDLLHNHKITQSLEAPLRQRIVEVNDAALDEAISGICSGLVLANAWEFLPEPNHRWAVNCTAETVQRSAQDVHLNILTGQFLVNGQSLGRVSKEFSNHELYKRVFGSRILQVFNSDMPSMSYMTSQTARYPQVHLGMRDGQELLIRTVAAGEMLEIIPHQYFEGDLPSYFVNEFVHWLNLRSGLLEFRPLQTLWDTSARNWRLHFREHSSSVMRLERRQLFDIRSHISNEILAILGVLEDKTNIHVTLNDTGAIEVELPRPKLHFFINMDGYLESKELAAVVDLNQELGSLYGLKNKLVLRRQNSRSVLIPFGSVLIEKTVKHTSIRIDTGKASKVQCFHYQVDHHLRKLRGPPGRLSLLYKAYLHAVTASVLPDPFTELSGTEEAISNLREASLYSYSRLDDGEFKVLGWISALTPNREFYPAHLRTMQRVKWNEKLGVLAQHDDFHVHAQAIVTHAAQFDFLYGDAPSPSHLKDRGDAQLLARARGRNSVFRTHDFVSGVIAGEVDVMHTARDSSSVSAQAQNIHNITTLIQRWPQSLEVERDLARLITSWGTVSGYGKQYGWTTPYQDLIGLSFSGSWGWLYNLCRSSNRSTDTYNLIFMFGPITFGHTNSMSLIRTLLAFAFSDRFTQMSAPQSSSFELSRGRAANLTTIRNAISGHYVPFVERPTGSQETKAQRRQRRDTYQTDIRNQTDQLANRLAAQWPIEKPRLPPNLSTPLIKVEAALTACQGSFQAWFLNMLYDAHIKQVSSQLALMQSGQMNLPTLAEPTFVYLAPNTTDQKALPGLLEILKLHAPAVLSKPPAALTAHKALIPSQSKDGRTELGCIIKKLKTHSDKTHQEYAENLDRSLVALRQGAVMEVPQDFPFSKAVLTEHADLLQSRVQEMLTELRRCLSPSSATSMLLDTAGLWPRYTPHALLSLLSATNLGQLSAGWRDCLISYGEAITLRQRSERLVRLFVRGDLVGFYREVESTGRQGWTSTEYPDFLLMEIENDLTIRPLQARVAAEMISPSTGSSSVLQLNMGEGKSSVIIPMVAAALADQQRLVRIVVLKPLLPQTNYLLSQRLGGLVNRRIYHTPFSRQTKLSTSVVATLRSIYEECKAQRGILLSLPEHILSFRLMGRERLSLPADRSLAGALMETEQWLHHNSRNILDESDEILDTRFQLVYTVGSQQLLDGQPDRWIIPQDILSLVDKHATELYAREPNGLEVERKGASFPFIRISRQELADELVSLIVKDVGEGYIRGISFDHCSRNVQAAALRFIENNIISGEDLDLVTQAFTESTLMGKLLLLRGLFAHNILRFALEKKRWLVEYGLTQRCLMAVPYKAKGVPAISAEFGHPEVAILLTCLSYYYTGIGSEQLRSCFNLLFREADPSHEYKRWCASGDSLPAKLHSLNAINMEDDALWTKEIVPRLRYSKAALDYYMSNVVFPREGKEFLKKLSTSSWDIPSSSEAGPTTGFSGTNDNRFLLPLSIQQHDLGELHDTNARVLDLLLQRENRTYICAKDNLGGRCSVKDLLRLISQQTPQIHVLIDVGAMVLEMQNFEVADEWLTNVPQAEAAVFFSENDEVMVIDRERHIERLVGSRFSQRLDGCLVYMDEVHTRGVDLNLPVNARAAVTLGPRLTKDRLVQACGRMRKLGSGQSLTFWAPPDIHQNILDLAGRSVEQLESSDVIQWALEMTCQATKQTKPLWAMQGFEHFQRTQSYTTLLGSTDDISTAVADDQRVSRYREEVQEPEAQTLHTMYGVHTDHGDPRSKLSEEQRLDPSIQRLSEVWDRLDTSRLQESLVHEEQEREIAHEVEREREIQRPGLMNPCEHKLLPEVITFVDNGTSRTRKGSAIFRPAFKGLQNTSAKGTLAALTSNLCPDLLATKDFCNTVKLEPDATLDDFMRPVNWVISSTKSTCLLIISPYEANQLLPKVQLSKTARLHVYAARTSKNMLSFADLHFYTIPSNSSIAPRPTAISLRNLNLFSGSLYFDSFAQYKALCDFLAVMVDRSRYRDRSDVQLASDGFVSPKNRKLLGWEEEVSPFERSPLPFLNELLGMRGKGRDFLQTHMGDLISGRVLKKEAFE